MRKILIRIGVLVAVFFLGIFLFSHFMNIENTDRTSAMAEPTLPVVYVRDGDQLINEMYGYTGQMQANYMRDTLTLLPSDYRLTVDVDTYGRTINKISYEVRSADATRLVENTEVTYLTEKDGYLEAELPLKKLLDQNEEYILQIVLHADNDQDISYYTRIVDRQSRDISNELAFCLDFSEKTFDPDQAVELSSYLEPNASGDNSSFAHVDIHSSYRMLVYSGLNAQRLTSPQLSVMEVRSNSSSFRLTYLVTTQEGENSPAYYNVTEYFRVRSGDGRMYLLDYERTMNQIFMQSGTEYGKSSITLGILDEAAEFQTSEDSKVAAFVQEGTLWSFNNTNGQVTRIYGDTDNITDVRSRRCDYEIKIADVDESGSMDFIVYGYMNRGDHEGAVGILACRYDATMNTVEEKAFIPYDKSFALMGQQMGRLAYINRNQQMYCMLDGAVYNINLNDRTWETVVENLPEDCYVLSEDGQVFAWLEEKDYDHSTNLHLLNLETGTSFVVSAGAGEYVRPVDFMEHDLVYGIADADSLTNDATGNLIFPMKAVKIVDEQGNDVREYSQSGIYILGARLEGAMITLERATLSDGTYVAISDDQIISNEKASESQTVQETFVTDTRKKQYRIVFSSELKEVQSQIREPKQVLFEVSRALSINRDGQTDHNFYVYGRGRLDMITQRAGDAIARADALQGVVVNGGQSYIWEKGGRVTKIQISGITARAAAAGESSVSVCVEQMLNYAGIYENVQEQMTTEGKTALDMLREYLPGQVVDLSGCSLDAALYFVSRGVPVFAMKSADTAALIVGYDEFGNLILYDAVSGSIGKTGPADSEAMFAAAGNVFISYVP